jgi:DNA-binding transcriptional ArsR family regulator
VRIAFSTQPKGPRVTIQDPAALKVLYDPLRFAIVGQLDQPLAVKEIAERLGEPISKLYYHLKTLEEHGIIRVADERAAGSNLERLFQRTGEEFVFSGQMVAPPPPGHLGQSLRSAVTRISEGMEWTQSGGSKVFSQFIDYREVRVSTRRVEEFGARLADLVNEFKDEETEATMYGFLCVISPVKPEKKLIAKSRKRNLRVVRSKSKVRPG